ncbi:hypothetical protein APH_0126 [Anaplasma phagocytophilum str. HZ]|uniref:Uncharacterized protein n=1 Tax=Anaplasma phagocytophilum (strain HZ) TaxID=212042 RepID=Q2GLJ8_ANAPZ|nr:hypothetical protein APH_0126 [Anaplasma phagocytophilum str. HZ]
MAWNLPFVWKDASKVLRLTAISVCGALNDRVL